MFSSWLSQAQEMVASAQEVAVGASKDFFTIENAQNEEEPAAVDLHSTEVFRSPSTIPDQLWETVLDVAFRDSNFFVIPPSRSLTYSEAQLEKVGILDTCRALTADRPLAQDQLQALASNQSIVKMHYDVMPRLISDEQFWQTLLWRLEVLRKCTSISQLLDVYELITTEANIGEPRQKLMGVDNKSYCEEMRARVSEVQGGLEWLSGKQSTVIEGLRNATGSCQLLNTFVSKEEKTELSDSVFESCKYHKSKIASLIGDLEANGAKLQNTDLDPQNGERYLELLQLNEELNRSIQAYTGIKAPGSQTVVASTPSGDVPDQAVVAAAADGEDFSAKLPWDDEDE